MRVKSKSVVGFGTMGGRTHLDRRRVSDPRDEKGGMSLCFILEEIDGEQAFVIRELG